MGGSGGLTGIWGPFGLALRLLTVIDVLHFAGQVLNRLCRREGNGYPRPVFEQLGSRILRQFCNRTLAKTSEPQDSRQTAAHL